MKLNSIKGIIFDYGGTLDTPGTHWAEVLWEGYRAYKIPVTIEHFREAYVHAERTLAKEPIIKPTHNFHALLAIKVDIEMRYLQEHKLWNVSTPAMQEAVLQVADYCYDYVVKIMETNREIVRQLSQYYPLVLVSNFYGNIHTILDDFNWPFFQKVIESAVVGVRKPNPEIFSLGVKALNLPAEEVVVIGDSFSKDIAPANSIGCRTVWLRGQGWGDEVVDETIPDAIITNLTQLPSLLPL